MRTPKKPCLKCKKNLTESTYCKSCEEKISVINKNKTVVYDNKRGTSKQRGYDKAWIRLRNKKIGLNSLCEICLENKRYRLAVLVHHKKTIEEHPELRLDIDNLQSLCYSCHEMIHKRNVNNLSKPNIIKPKISVTIISGPPASGKTTYANKVATKKDIVIDLDAIANDMFINRRGYHNWDRNNLNDVLAMRNKMINNLDNYDKCYLIISAPDKSTRQWWIRKMNATCIVIEASFDVCVDRLKKDGRFRIDTMNVISNWWNNYERISTDIIIKYT